MSAPNSSFSFTVQDLPIFDRPRERLLSRGAAALSSAELLAVILGQGSRGESVLLLAQKLLSSFGSLQDDLRFTQRLVEAGKILGVPVVDHLIITPLEFLSFKQHGLI